MKLTGKEVSQTTRQLIYHRTKAALERKRNKGEGVGGRAPYGHRWAGNDSLMPDLGEMRTIRQIRELHYEGRSTRQIEAILVGENIVNRKGKKS